MSKFIDYYKTLQVDYDAKQEIINAAYRCFSKIYHPDVNNNEGYATERMKMINIAYNTIGNPRKRKDYHQEWLKNNNVQVARPIVQNTVQTENRVKYQKPVVSEEAIAKEALETFFDDLIKESWEKSYQKLTAADRNNIPLKEYIDWKEAVTQLYKLGNYKIQYFNTYENCEYAGINFSKIHHFSVTLTEMEVFTGKISQENTQKYVALDEGKWCICLGYSDLRPSIRKYEYLARALPKLNRDEIISKALGSIDPQTGLLSRKGFTDHAMKEFERTDRYGNPLALATIEIRPTETGRASFEEERELLVCNFAEALSSNIRSTDIIGRISETAIGLLFIETKVESAKATLMRLLKLIDIGETLNYDIYWAITAPNNEDIEFLLTDTLKNAVLIEKALKDEKGSKKLGKYNLADIMEFNKKGTNHF